MIDKALEITAQELENYLNLRFSDRDGLELLVTDLLNQDGSPKTYNNDVVTVTLLNLEEEKAIRNRNRPTGSQAAYHLNLYLLFCTFYGENSSYLMALEHLGAVLSFFQANAVMDHHSTPELNLGIEKLVFELENQNMQMQNYTWSMLGNRYVPSVLYKVRMIIIDEGQINQQIGQISGFGSDVR